MNGRVTWGGGWGSESTLRELIHMMDIGTVPLKLKGLPSPCNRM